MPVKDANAERVGLITSADPFVSRLTRQRVRPEVPVQLRLEPSSQGNRRDKAAVTGMVSAKVPVCKLAWDEMR